MSIFKRVSIRKYLNKQVEGDKIELILKAGMQAPSAVNQQPWEFMVCQDRETIDKVTTYGGFARSLVTAPTCLILYYKTDISHPNFVMQDMGACTQNCLLQATELGLGACWMGVAPKEDRMAMVEEIFGKLPNAKPFCLIALGYPDEEKEQISRFDEQRIHYFKK